MSNKKSAECVPCVYWRRNGCEKNQPGWPDVGAFCISYVREPGSDDDIDEDGEEK